MTGTRAPQSFFAVPAEVLAPKLIGCTLVRQIKGKRVAGRIIEVEAYVGRKDKASHAYGGHRTPRVEAMYAAPGTVYVYFTYGMHFCMNVVCGVIDEPVAVLIRALEPLEGIPQMQRSRKRLSKVGLWTLMPRGLCSGPGKICESLQIDRSMNATDLTTSEDLFIELPEKRIPRRLIRRTTRIGIGEKGEEWVEKPLRWLLDGHPHLSAVSPYVRKTKSIKKGAATKAKATKARAKKKSTKGTVKKRIARRKKSGRKK